MYDTITDMHSSSFSRRYLLVGPRSETGELLQPSRITLSREDRAEILRLHDTGMTPKQIQSTAFPDKKYSAVKRTILRGPEALDIGENDRIRKPWTREQDKTILRMRQVEQK